MNRQMISNPHILRFILCALTAVSIFASTSCTQCSHKDGKEVEGDADTTGKRTVEVVPEKGEDAFVRFVSQNATSLSSDESLAPFGDAVGSAKYVALSEAVHNGKESLETNVRLIKYLIQEKEFTIVALESALPESRLVNDYILGKNNASKDALMKSLDGRYRWREFFSLVEWMREYNSTHAVKVQMLGLDITGYYQSLSYSLGKLHSYIVKSDKFFADYYDSQFYDILDELASAQSDIFMYYRKKLSIDGIITLRQLILTAVERINDKKDMYVNALGKTEYQWCRQTAINLLLTINFYDEFRNYGKDYSLSYGANGRELAMKDNFEWMLTMNPGAKVVMIDHVYHTRTQMRHFGDYEYIISFGTLLKGKYGDDFYSVGCVYKSVYDSKHVVGEGDLAYILDKTGKADFFIDLRKCRDNAKLKPYLSSDVLIWEYDDPLLFQIDEFDGYVFYDMITAPTK